MTEPEPELTVHKVAGVFAASPQLLGDYAGFSDRLGKVLSGEVKLPPRPPEPQPWHRCLACWLVSKLPGHDRCRHGRLDCDDCRDDC